MIRKIIYATIIFLMIPANVWALAANKTWTSGEILTHTDLNYEFTWTVNYIEQNRDMIKGDNGCASGADTQNHEGGGRGVNIDVDAMADDDWGDFSISSHVATLDADVVDNAEIAANAVDPNQLKETDFGDFTVSSNTATIDGSAVTTTKINNDAITYAKMDHTLLGYMNSQRATFTYSDTDTITIGAASYAHNGSVSEGVYWSSTLTYDFQNLAATDWSYLYIDDSAVVTLGSNLLTASQLIDSTTEPAWSATKHGWYNGHDRCIFAVLTNGSSQILEFYQEGDLVVFADKISNRAAADLDTTWEDVTLSAPKFTTKVLVFVKTTYSNGEVSVAWRTNGQSGTGGHTIAYSGVAVTTAGGTTPVIADPNQVIEIVHSASNDNTAAAWTDGWYFPDGV